MVLQEACGVIGVYTSSKAAPLIYLGLLELQHRGQESAGISTSDGHSMYTKRGMGLVSEVFRTADDFADLEGNYGVGQVRYSTAGSSTIDNAQPIAIETPFGKMALAHNGNIPNTEKIRRELLKDGYKFQSTSDTEVIAYLIAHGRDVVDGIKLASKELVGSYSLTILTKDGVFGVRGPFGVRPLAIGVGENCYCIASESCAFPPLDMELVRDVRPGEIVVVQDGELSTAAELPSRRRSMCVFELVYFARPDSIIDGVHVGEFRKALGRRLAERDSRDGLRADVVAPLPYSGIMHEVGYQNASGLPHDELFMRKRFSHRSFTDPTIEGRRDKAEKKLSVLPGSAAGRSVVLVEDSIVRGTTAPWAVEQLKGKAGAREVHLRITSPPIRHPCPLGIDTKTEEELAANGKSIEDIRRMTGADSLMYQTLDDLVEATGFSEQELCLGCWTGRYPALEREPIPSQSSR